MFWIGRSVDRLPGVAGQDLPPSSSGTPVPAERVAPTRRRRPVLLVLLILVGAAVLVGGVGAVVLYERATAIDRSTPAAVARQFLQAAIGDRDDARVALFICRDWTTEHAIAETLDRLDPEAKATWVIGETVLTRAGEAVVNVRVRLQYPGEVAPSGEETWELILREESGWRACGIEKRS